MEDTRAIDTQKRQYLEFFENQQHGSKYIDKISETIAEKRFRLIVNINDIRNFDPDLAASILQRPREHMIALQEAATELARNNPTNAKILKTSELQVGFDGSFGTHSVSPRGLVANLLNKLVIVEGIVTKCSSVRPKLAQSVHFCPNTKAYTRREYRDATALDIGIEVRGRERLPTSSAIPTKDNDGNPLEMEHGYSVYKDYQTIVLQEMPERARVGQLPRSIELILENDLVDRVKPGDRVQCIGIYRPLASIQNGASSGVFKSVLICNNISVMGKEVGAVRLTGNDVANIREVSEKSDLLGILSRSLCPSIYGHEYVKKALILQLLGGNERTLENGTHLRGDINVMMVGDPSTAKSQLLRSIMEIAPLAISTTGRGSSGVGLTAAVTSDQETGQRTLEAGAMVLADRGIVCIDEFDKMNEADRVAIHEVMEQQTVTIAKAGIHASLNARCSVACAANPVYGQYDRTRRPQENIGLPDSLLSRFDLLFIVLDQLDPVMDRQLAEHVIRSHQYRRPGATMEPEPLNQHASLHLEDPVEDPKDTDVWQKGGKLVGGDNGNTKDILSKDFLMKYVHYAKTRMHPVLTEDAMESISIAYADMRGKQTPKNLPVTARTLETIIRLSTAHAKCRLSVNVEEEDVEAALELMNFVMFHEVGDFTSQTIQRSDGPPSQQFAVPKRPRKQDEEDSTSNDDDDDDDSVLRKKRAMNLQDSRFEGDGVPIPVDRSLSKYRRVGEVIDKIRATTGMDIIDFKYLLERLNYAPPGSTSSSYDNYGSQELISMLAQLENENKIMFEDEKIIVL